MEWTAGYRTDLEYTYGYYRELAPELLTLACLNAAFDVGRTQRYLELGFGQGLSVNIHAAANPGEFWGTDFNPAQAGHAAGLAEAAGAGARLLDASFEEFARRDDVPEFDIIVLHGIWTWISAENRRTVVDIVRRHLRVGGIFYISYNTFPGWAPFLPLRHLLTLHSELAGSDAAGTPGKVDNALKFAQQVAEANGLYFRINPLAAERLKRITEQNRNYVAHEYFNSHWDIMAFSDVARALEEAKLTFAASAALMDHIDSINVGAAGRKLLNELQNPVLRQSVRDYLVNQQFRRDIFIKGGRRIQPLEFNEQVRARQFVLTAPLQDVPMKVTAALGEASLQETVYRPLLEALAQDQYAPKTVEWMARRLPSLTLAHLWEALIVLVGAGHVQPAREPTAATRAQCRALNRHLCARARGSADIVSLASPVVGGGIGVSRVEQLFLLALGDGKSTASEMAASAWAVLGPQGHKVQKGGKALQSPEENLAELTDVARLFSDKRLPVLKALEVTL